MIDFVDMTLLEKEMVLSWRNNGSVKRWMYNKEDISLENHLKFIETIENKTSKHYSLVKMNNEYIGVVDFTNIDFKNAGTDFGLYANPFVKIAGIGRVLEEVCIYFAFSILNLRKLKLEVFRDNKQAINLYKKYNFEEIDRKIIKAKEVICMELKNETI